MLEQALRYQTQGDEWVRRVAIGGALLFLSFLVVPAFTFYGYLIEVIRQVLRGEETPPEWEPLDLVAVTVDGVKAMGIVLAYSFGVTIVAMVPFVLFAILGFVLDSGIVGLGGWLVGVALAVVGGLVLAVVTPIATVNFALEDDISAGFDVGVIRGLATNGTLLKHVVLALVVNIAVNVVGFVLGLTIVGILLGPFLTFVGTSAVFYLWAKGFAGAYESVYGDLPPVPDTPVPDSGVGTLEELLDSGGEARPTQAEASGEPASAAGNGDPANEDEPR